MMVCGERVSKFLKYRMRSIVDAFFVLRFFTLRLRSSQVEEEMLRDP